MMIDRVRLIVCMAGIVAGSVAAADQLPTRPGDRANAPQSAIPDPSLTPREINEREQEYLAALKKCEPLAEVMRQDCISTVKSKYGLM